MYHKPAFHVGMCYYVELFTMFLAKLLCYIRFIKYILVYV